MIGILLTNSGTPSAPTKSAVRTYLREFLSDPRIVQLPRLVWWPILYGLILPIRSQRSAKFYQAIWQQQGSPMRVIMHDLAAKLSQDLAIDCQVEIGMNYGDDSIFQAINKLKHCERIVVIPLYPQYSHTTTASTADRLRDAINSLKPNSEILFQRSYATHEQYIDALAKRVNQHWQNKQRHQHLLISFHGIPERYAQKGDPYPFYCEQTATLLASKLNLNADEWTLCYQSQFGYDRWLQPSTQLLFSELPAKGIKTLDVVCPGFAVDCLETLEEIALRGKKTFLNAGGTSLEYIQALNDHPEHIKLLRQLINSSLGCDA